MNVAEDFASHSLLADEHLRAATTGLAHARAVGEPGGASPELAPLSSPISLRQQAGAASGPIFPLVAERFAIKRTAPAITQGCGNTYGKFGTYSDGEIVHIKIVLQVLVMDVYCLEVRKFSGFIQMMELVLHHDKIDIWRVVYGRHFVWDEGLEIHGVGGKTVQNVLKVMVSGMMPFNHFCAV
jgi:hypothetical protein